MSDTGEATSRRASEATRKMAVRMARGMIGTVGVRIGDTVLALVISVALARMLGAKSYGVFAYAVAVVSVLRPISVLGLPNLLIQLVSSYRVEHRDGLLRGLLRRSDQAVMVLALAVTLVALAAVGTITGRTSGDAHQVTLLAIVFLPFIAFVSMREAGLRGFEHVIAGTMPDATIRPSIFIVVGGIVFLLTRSTSPQVYTIVDGLAATTAFLVAHIWYRRWMPRNVARAEPAYETAEWLRSSVPFSVWSVLTIVNLKIDVLLLGLFVDSKAIALYVVASQIVRAIGVICLSAMNFAVGPYVARFHAEGSKEHLQNLVTWSTWLTFLMALPATVLMMFWSGPFLSLVFGHEFAAGATVSALLALALTIRTAIGSVGQTLMMTGHARTLMIQTAIGTALAIVLCVVLIPIMGSLGAAVGSSVALIAASAMNAVAVWRKVGVVPTILRRPRRLSA